MKAFVCLFVCLLPTFAQEAIPLSNADFDDDLLLEGEWQTSLSGWVIVGTAGVFNPTETQYPTEDGSRDNVGFTNNGTLVQVTNELLTADTLYTLSLEVGRRDDLSNQPPVTLRFVAGGEVLAQSGGYAIDSGQWRNTILTLVATNAQPIGQPLEIHLISTDTQVHYDNLSLTKGPASGNNSGNTTNGAIVSDQTLQVPSQYSTIQEALASFALKRIAPGNTVTIQVEDGNYENYDTVEVDHVDGKKINIVGNISDPSLCVLNFKPGVDGVSVTLNRALGHIDGFTFQGSNQTGVGLHIRWGGFIGAGSQMILNDFRNGVYAVGAMVSCPGIQVNSAYDGIVSYYGSIIDGNSAIVQGSLGHGFVVGINGVLLAHGSVAKDNGSAGFQSWLGGTARVWSSISQNNLHGYRASDLSVISAKDSQVSGNGTDYIATENSIIKQ